MTLLTGNEAAARLGICERTLRKLRQAGAIPYVALTSRMIRYTAEDCDAFIADCRRRECPASIPAVAYKGSKRACPAETGFMAKREARRKEMRTAQTENARK